MTRDLSAVGCTGVVVTPTRGAEGTGEVVLSIRGGTEAFLAWSDQPLPKGARVIAIDVRGPRTVQVVSADDLGLVPMPFD